jgi:predicted CoA-binding protein
MEKVKRTVVLGASNNPNRESFRVVTRMSNDPAIEVLPVGIKKGDINGVDIINGTPHFDEVHTVTLYLGARNQVDYYEYILSLKPERLIFNPGAENAELYDKARRAGIEVHDACTMTMMVVGMY